MINLIKKTLTQNLEPIGIDSRDCKLYHVGTYPRLYKESRSGAWGVVTSTLEELKLYKSLLSPRDTKISIYIQFAIEKYEDELMEEERLEQERARLEKKKERLAEIQLQYTMPTTRRNKVVNYSLETKNDEFTGPQYEVEFKASSDYEDEESENEEMESENDVEEQDNPVADDSSAENDEEDSCIEKDVGVNEKSDIEEEDSMEKDNDEHVGTDAKMMKDDVHHISHSHSTMTLVNFRDLNMNSQQKQEARKAKILAGKESRLSKITATYSQFQRSEPVPTTKMESASEDYVPTSTDKLIENDSEHISDTQNIQDQSSIQSSLNSLLKDDSSLSNYLNDIKGMSHDPSDSTQITQTAVPQSFIAKIHPLISFLLPLFAFIPWLFSHEDNLNVCNRILSLETPKYSPFLLSFGSYSFPPWILFVSIELGLISIQYTLDPLFQHQRSIPMLAQFLRMGGISAARIDMLQGSIKGMGVCWDLYQMFMNHLYGLVFMVGMSVLMAYVGLHIGLC